MFVAKVEKPPCTQRIMAASLLGDTVQFKARYVRARVGHAFAKPKAFADVVWNAGSTLYICFRPVAVALAAAAAPPS